MVTVPAFLLRRLYVKGSLKNTSGGFEFELRNRLGSGYAYKLWPLKVDGTELPADRTVFNLDGRTVAFSDVAHQNTFLLAMNKTITIQVYGTTLAPGPRKLDMAFDVPGFGTLRFDFKDVVPEG